MTGEALVLYMNKIRMSVCLFDRYLLLGNMTGVHIFYMVGSGIYPEVSPFMFRICPANCPDAIFRGFWNISPTSLLNIQSKFYMKVEGDELHFIGQF